MKLVRVNGAAVGRFKWLMFRCSLKFQVVNVQVLLFDIPSGHWAEAEAKSELWEKARIAVPPEVSS